MTCPAPYGFTDNVEFATPVTNSGDLQNAPTSNQIGILLNEQLNGVDN